jgi:hypothetical protein
MAKSKGRLLSELAEAPKNEDYANVNALPNTGNKVGDQAFVEETDRLYIWNGSGWYNIALINTTPTWDSGGQPEGSYVLDADSPQTATTITLAASDPEGLPISYTYVTGGSMDSIATISQDSSVFTITPKTEAQAPDGGTGSITFRASDGVNILPQVSSFTLEFLVDWSTGGSLEHTLTGLSSAGWDANISIDATGERLFLREYESSSVFALGIYKRTGSSWSLEQEFTDPTDSLIQYTAGSHLFKIGENGDWVAWNRSPTNGGAGTRVTFARRSGTTWTTEQVGDGNGAYWFISGDGNHVFSAYPSNTTTLLWRFQYSGGTWSQNNITSMSLPGVGYRRSGGSNYDGTEIILGNYSTDTAYRCSVSGSTVTVQETLTGDSGKLFPFYDNSAGNSIVYSKNGLTLAIYQRYGGAVSGTARNGKIFIYRRSSTSNNFGSAAVTYAGTSAANNYLGSQLSISDDGLFVAFGEDVDNNVFVAELDTGTGNWTKHTVNIPAGEGGSTYVAMSADASRIAYWGGTLSPSSSNKLFIYKV